MSFGAPDSRVGAAWAWPTVAGVATDAGNAARSAPRSAPDLSLARVVPGRL